MKIPKPVLDAAQQQANEMGISRAAVLNTWIYNGAKKYRKEKREQENILD